MKRLGREALKYGNCFGSHISSSEQPKSPGSKRENGRTKSRRNGIMEFAAGTPFAGASGQDGEEIDSLYSWWKAHSSVDHSPIHPLHIKGIYGGHGWSTTLVRSTRVVIRVVIVSALQGCRWSTSHMTAKRLVTQSGGSIHSSSKLSSPSSCLCFSVPL